MGYWPDGSIRLMWVRGLWKGPIAESHKLVLKPDRSVNAGASILPKKTSDANAVIIDHPPLPKMKISFDAGLVPLSVAKKLEKTNDSKYWDEIGQYHWAQKQQDVSPDSKRIDLQLQVRDIRVELNIPAYTVSTIRGSAAREGHADDLEWQLRVFAFKGAPLMRFEMTWKVYFDPEAFALSDAVMTVDLPTAVTQTQLPDVKADAMTGPVVLTSTPDARFTLAADGKAVHEDAGPSHAADAWMLSTGDGFLALALPDFTMKGPGSVEVNKTRLKISTWNGNSGMVLDLRRSVDRNEPGMGEGDFAPEIDARGLSFTTHASLAFSADRQQAKALLDVEKSMDHLWYATGEEFFATRALGAWDGKILKEYPTFFDGLLANVTMVARSQNQWRWTGLINYGDSKTDYARGTDKAKGFYAGRWLHTGRYGWRHGSGQPYAGFGVIGLVKDSRECLDLARRYAHHVANVDVRQPRYWGKSLPLSGGMHRRNMDHWSGNIQTQYTPSWGMYVQYWLTADARMGDALEAIRDFSAQGSAGSIYSAAAYFHHYGQTHYKPSLDKGIELYEKCMASWTKTTAKKFPEAKATGPSALYYKNFRRLFDLYHVLIHAHYETGDKRFLNAIYENLRTHIPLNMRLYEGTLNTLTAPAYLLANGYTRQQIGEEYIQYLEEQLGRYIPGELPTYGPGDYEAVRHISSEMLPPFGNSTYRRSLWIGLRATSAPLVFSYITPRVPQTQPTTQTK